MSQKFLFLLADGMGDWPIESLSGKTPLEVAKTPVMDRLAKEGVVGTCATIPETMPPGSDVANMALLGFNPETYHTGRGPIEAAAQGLELKEDDVVWRTNLVTIDNFGPDGIMRDYSGGHIHTETSRVLVNAVANACGSETFEFIPGVQYRHLLVQKGGASAPEAQFDIRPPHDITDQPIDRDYAVYAQSPRLLAYLNCAASVLAEHSDAGAVTNLWPWGQGKALRLPQFADLFGRRSAVISAVDLIKGLGRAAGMDVIDIPGATGLLDTNYQGKVDAAISFLNGGGDFVFVHLEGPDECGHGGQIEDKIESIARFDKLVAAPLSEAFPDAAVLVCCDHFTPIAVKTHTKDPVPFFLHAKGLPASGVSAFTERTAQETGLHIDKGYELLPYAFSQIG
ncbi:cofactor-independent phosphoglycerate mutase [Desulfovibrio inopinatus]|uniref:cofactor-independent phosphoglycerate mutase n=1 Tax=Desulfovibrio inopinatus TaxID=102109 RepID=UPI0004251401|nr:cofactor-independent phosphoglycerate mutase [Desulfovibrio inopinatus]